VKRSGFDLERPDWRAFSGFWQYAVERQRVFDARCAGARPPFSEAFELKRWRYCNVFRAADRTTQYAIQRVIFHPVFSAAPEDVFLRVLLFRTFGRIGTWVTLNDAIGEPKAATFAAHVPALNEALEARRTASDRQGDAIFSDAVDGGDVGAYGGCTLDSRTLRALRTIAAALDDAPQVRTAATFDDVARVLFDRFRTAAGVQSRAAFLAHNCAVDLNYALTDFDENDAVGTTPAERTAIARVFPHEGAADVKAAVSHMVAAQEAALSACGVDPVALRLFGARPITAVDASRLFFDARRFADGSKYCGGVVRQCRPFTGNPKALYARIDGFYFPRKWNLNGFVPNSLRAKGFDF
jgi:hypothetical protein